MHKNNTVCLFSLAVAMLFGVLSPIAHAANPFTPVASAAQVMLQTQADDAAFIAADFGVDPNSPLQYASSIDPSGSSFSFSLAPNSTYQGQPITLTATGTLNQATQTWTVTSSGSIAGTPWTGTISMSVSLTGSALQMNLTSSAQFSSGGLQHQEADITGVWCNGVYYPNDSNGVLFYTGSLSPCAAYYYGTLVTSWDVIGLTNTDPQTNNSVWNLAINDAEIDFSVASSGSYPSSGGLGSFSAIVGPAKTACTNCSQ
jgi:hypothetical protein